MLRRLPELDRAFAEFARVLRTGGTLLFAGEPSRRGDRLAAFPKRAGLAVAPLWRRLVGARAAPAGARRPTRPTITGYEGSVDVHAFVPAELERHARDAGLAGVRVRGEELVANWFGWFNRSLEATAVAREHPAGLVPLRLPRATSRCRKLDATLLEPRLPAGGFYNAHARRAEGRVDPGACPSSPCSAPATWAARSSITPRRRGLGRAAIARSQASLEGIDGLGIQADASDPEGALRAALARVRSGARRPGSRRQCCRAPRAARAAPFGGGALAEATLDDFRGWGVAVAEQAFVFLSEGGRALERGGRTLVQVTGGSARRAIHGRGLWAAGAAATRALAPRRRPGWRSAGIHVALLIVGRHDHSPKTSAVTRGSAPEATASQEDVARAVAALAARDPRAGFTHQLVVTPAGDRWLPRKDLSYVALPRHRAARRQARRRLRLRPLRRAGASDLLRRYPHHLRALVGDRVVLDTERAHCLLRDPARRARSGRPARGLRRRLLERTDHSTHSR